MKRIKIVAYTALLGMGIASNLACSASLCQRKESFFSSKCVGTDVVWTPDARCEKKIENCNEGQLAQMNAYVTCLESANECSNEVIQRCQQQNAYGVNLSCGG